MEIFDGILEWAKAHPAMSVAAGVAFAVLIWWMRRPDPVLSAGGREFDRLTRKNRGKYDKLRPL